MATSTKRMRAPRERAAERVISESAEGHGHPGARGPPAGLLGTGIPFTQTAVTIAVAIITTPTARWTVGPRPARRRASPQPAPRV